MFGPPTGSGREIAVVGFSCRLPRAADPTAFWRLLRDGVDAVIETPSQRGPGGEILRGGYLDAEFFGIPPRERRGDGSAAAAHAGTRLGGARAHRNRPPQHFAAGGPASSWARPGAITPSWPRGTAPPRSGSAVPTRTSTSNRLHRPLRPVRRAGGCRSCPVWCPGVAGPGCGPRHCGCSSTLSGTVRRSQTSASPWRRRGPRAKIALWRWPPIVTNWLHIHVR